MPVSPRDFYRRLAHRFVAEPRRKGEMRVTFRPPDPRFDTIWELLGKQTEPCHFEPGKLLKNVLFCNPERFENVEIFNISEEYLGLNESFAGWSFVCRYEEREECACL